MSLVLFTSVFVIATCGLVYELICSTLASYLLGDSVTQFSTVIGAYLFSMGVGSYLSKFIKRAEIAMFVQVELLIGVVGGCSAAIMFTLFEHVESFRIVLYTLVGLIGMLVGLEVPLLLRILKERYEFRDLVAHVFTFDYVGALLASLLFPLVLVPYLGLVRSCFLFGMFNVLVALWLMYLFRTHSRPLNQHWGAGCVALVLLAFGVIYADNLVTLSESQVYPHKVIFAKSSPYQRVVLTRHHDDLRLYLNSHLQFSSRDEYRYHEALVHVGLAGLNQPQRVLILGGGDGLALREVLKYPSVTHVTLVDLDKSVTDLFTAQPLLTQLNADALHSKRVQVLNTDAFVWLKGSNAQFDFIIADFPDPTNYSVGKLYTTTFFRQLHKVLAPDGRVVVQSTSPLIARQSFWCVVNTLENTGFATLPYHTYVPSFGEWGFILAGTQAPQLPPAERLPQGLRYLTASAMQSMVQFPTDMMAVHTEVNRLDNQVLVRYFDRDWSGYE